MMAVKDAVSAGAVVDLPLRSPDRDAPIPLHEQVAAEIRKAIADGEARPGERIPKAKDLAAVLGVNTNTVLRALRALQDEGILELRRRRGITVAATPDRSRLIEQARALLDTGRRLGQKPAETVALLAHLARTYEPNTGAAPAHTDRDAR